MPYHALLLKQRGTNLGLSTSLHTERRQGPIRRKMDELDTGSLGFGGRRHGSFVYSYVLARFSTMDLQLVVDVSWET